jgi:hypothetical protein
MKVCLDVCKAYSADTLVEKTNNILEGLPFDTEE